MKTIYLSLLLFFIFNCVLGQTKIVDASVNWENGTVHLYLTDTTALVVALTISTTDYQSHDVFNESFSLGTDLPRSNDLILPIAGVTPGMYYFDIKVTTISNGIQEMEFQTSN